MSKVLINPMRFTNYAVRDSQNRPVERDTEDIADYPIAEAALDATGNPIWDNAAGTYRTTGRTLEFTLLRGQAAEFEDYVANILLDRYEFLSEKHVVSKAVKGMMPPAEEVKKEAGEIRCKHCGQSFRGMNQLGLHTGVKHPNELTG